MESDGARSAAGAADEDAVVADVVSPYKGSAVPRASVLTKVGELSAASSALAHAPRESAQALRMRRIIPLLLSIPRHAAQPIPSTGRPRLQHLRPHPQPLLPSAPRPTPRNLRPQPLPMTFKPYLIALWRSMEMWALRSPMAPLPSRLGAPLPKPRGQPPRCPCLLRRIVRVLPIASWCPLQLLTPITRPPRPRGQH